MVGRHSSRSFLSVPVGDDQGDVEFHDPGHVIGLFDNWNPGLMGSLSLAVILRAFLIVSCHSFAGPEADPKAFGVHKRVFPDYFPCLIVLLDPLKYLYRIIFSKSFCSER